MHDMVSSEPVLLFNSTMLESRHGSTCPAEVNLGYVASSRLAFCT